MIDEEALSSPAILELEAASNIVMRVGEIVSTVPHPTDPKQFVHCVRLSRICSPRTIISGLSCNYSAAELHNTRVIVVTGFPTQDSTLSQGILVCDANGSLLQVDEAANVGERISFRGSSTVLQHLKFDQRGHVVCTVGEPIATRADKEARPATAK